MIKQGVIVEYNSGYFKGIFPVENNSALSGINEILKVHHPERIPNSCKYYIQHSINGEVMNIYLNINIIQYWQLNWQLKNI
ncbi:hypothetical protein [Algibacter lectus]|uniref:hypothetical protein n=1 Tax=Algibacter lectus TaxID=221126 RepID=UPI00249571F0|nr:hypothetical protein [Algibacter lectus]